MSRETPDHHQRLENLKASLKAAYKYVNKSNKKSHQDNKRLYDRRAKLRKFKVGDIVYLYSPAMKPGLSRKFNKPWSGPHKITRVVTHLMSMQGLKSVFICVIFKFYIVHNIASHDAIFCRQIGASRG